MLKKAMVAGFAITSAGALQGCSNAGAQMACTDFLEVRAALEQNLTDGDAEVLLFAKTPDEGLRRLVINNPGGIELTLDTPNALGQREFLFESAEPTNLNAVLAAFPQGTYTFTGTTVSGGCVNGTTQLSHVSAPATTLLTPMQDEVVAAGPVMLSWSSTPQATSYAVELTNESNGAVYALDVLPPQTSITIPRELLPADSEYTYAVATKTATGNIASVELSFTTAP